MNYEGRLDIAPEKGIKTIPKIKKCNKAKWLSEEGLQIVLIGGNVAVVFQESLSSTL